MTDQVTDEVILAFLDKHPLAFLATTGPSQEPRAAAIFFTANKDFTFYFITKVSTTKYQQLQQNSSVALAVADQQTFQTVQLEGKAEEETQSSTKAEIIERLAKISGQHPNWRPPIAQLPPSSYAIIKITPTWLRWADFGTASAEPVFREVISPSD